MLLKSPLSSRGFGPRQAAPKYANSTARDEGTVSPVRPKAGLTQRAPSLSRRLPSRTAQQEKSTRTVGNELTPTHTQVKKKRSIPRTAKTTRGAQLVMRDWWKASYFQTECLGAKKAKRFILVRLQTPKGLSRLSLSSRLHSRTQPSDFRNANPPT